MHAANYGQAIARRKRLVEEAEQRVRNDKWSYTQEAIKFAIGKMATSVIECEEALDIELNPKC